MTPRQLRRGIDIYTGAVIASVAVALAGLTWRLTGDPGVGPMAAPIAANAGQVSDLRPLIALTPFGSAATMVVAAGPMDTTIKLKAIFMAIPAEASSVLIAGSDGKVAVYGLGAAVGGGIINSIGPEQIVLRTAQGLQTIGFNPAAAGVGPTSMTTATMTGPAAPTSQLAPVAPPAPPLSVSAPEGYSVGNAPPPALLAAGIHAGDVIVQLNGAPVGARSNERELVGAAMAAGTARIEVLRDGRRVSLSAAMH